MKNQNDRKETARMLSRMSHVTGFGISLITPIFLLMWGAMWLQERFGFGDWIVVVALVCGLISGGLTFYHFVTDEIKRAEKEGAEYLRQQKERSRQDDNTDKGKGATNKDET